MKSLSLNGMEHVNGGLTCAWDFSNTDPVCVGLFTGFAASSAGTNFNGGIHVCSTASMLGCTLF